MKPFVLYKGYSMNVLRIQFEISFWTNYMHCHVCQKGCSMFEIWSYWKRNCQQIQHSSNIHFPFTRSAVTPYFSFTDSLFLVHDWEERGDLSVFFNKHICEMDWHGKGVVLTAVLIDGSKEKCFTLVKFQNL